MYLFFGIGFGLGKFIGFVILIVVGWVEEIFLVCGIGDLFLFEVILGVKNELLFFFDSFNFDFRLGKGDVNGILEVSILVGYL